MRPEATILALPTAALPAGAAPVFLILLRTGIDGREHFSVTDEQGGDHDQQSTP
ncbi:MAG TPA: hypothetical protein VNF47_20680 [Streptosporangiaceae bacterium]|nr:hypothetical protein [Streptosporangiaceae bacterium]